ncbi:MAG: hypothetical protein A2Z88_08070 [Omnitrophica WOR_2 bacterium GWA2_47_8]|nr:MAG: hypothetical protein A2Z88_08070 [Omnitrophica WOR_2 bacterium GWA2_47_8]
MKGLSGSFKKAFAVQVGFIFILALAVALSGCEPLRKKFVRQKKKDKTQTTESLPLLEPEDYPETTQSAMSKYRHFYQLWKVWVRDLSAELSQSANEKALQYKFNQILVNLEEMKKLLTEEKQKELTRHLEALRSIQQALDLPRPLRNNQDIARHVEAVSKEIKNNFQFENVKGFITQE